MSRTWTRSLRRLEETISDLAPDEKTKESGAKTLLAGSEPEEDNELVELEQSSGLLQE